MPPAESTGRSIVSSTCPSNINVGTEPVWPPPSAPCAMTASTPHSATFSPCRRAPMVGIVTMPWSLSCFMIDLFGAVAKLATGTPIEMIMSTRSWMSGASVRRFTPNGLLVPSWISSIALLICLSVRVAAARMPKPPALLTAITSGGYATHPMPVWTMG